MKTLYLKEHSFICEATTEKNAKRIKKDSNDFYDMMFEAHQCGRFPEKIIFYNNLEFYMIVYNPCIRHGNSEAEFLQGILNRSIKSKSKKGRFDRSIVFDKVFMKLREDSLSFNDKIIDINYLYQDASGKQYSIIREYDFDPDLDHNSVLRQKTKEAKEYILENYKSSCERDFFIDQIDRLFHANLIYEYDERFIVNTVSDLVKQINKKANEK